MADALDSGSSGGNTVRVQVPFSALEKSLKIKDFFSYLFAFLYPAFWASSSDEKITKYFESAISSYAACPGQ